MPPPRGDIATANLPRVSPQAVCKSASGRNLEGAVESYRDHVERIFVELRCNHSRQPDEILLRYKPLSAVTL